MIGMEKNSCAGLSAGMRFLENIPDGCRIFKVIDGVTGRGRQGSLGLPVYCFMNVCPAVADEGSRVWISKLIQVLP
jgi:hypothetical protein